MPKLRASYELRGRAAPEVRAIKQAELRREHAQLNPHPWAREGERQQALIVAQRQLAA